MDSLLTILAGDYLGIVLCIYRVLKMKVWSTMNNETIAALFANIVHMPGQQPFYNNAHVNHKLSNIFLYFWKFQER